MTTLYVVTALHNTGHGDLASVVMVTKDPKKALSIARFLPHETTYQFYLGGNNGVFVSKITPEVLYDHLPGDPNRSHKKPTDSDALLFFRCLVCLDGRLIKWEEHFYNDWEKKRPYNSLGSYDWDGPRYSTG